MKFRLLLISLLTVLSTLLVGVPTAAADRGQRPGCGCTDGVPAGVPALDLLRPTSSTTVSAGGVVSIAANYVQVRVQPTSEFIYRGPKGVIRSVAFDTDSFTLTVPADWRPGRYKLTKIVTTSLGVGIQFRSHRLVGATVDSPDDWVCGRSDLNLRVLDLTVTS